jgi:cell division initiation protein
MTEEAPVNVVPTPEEIRSPKLGRAFRGYETTAVDRLLAQVARSVEELAKERDELRARVAKLESTAGEESESQRLLHDALITAQRAAEDMKERTQRECDALLERARAEAAEIERRSQIEREQVEAEIERLRSQERELRASYRVLLAAALDRLEPSNGEDSAQSSLLDALAPRRAPAPANGGEDS